MWQQKKKKNTQSKKKKTKSEQVGRIILLALIAHANKVWPYLKDLPIFYFGESESFALKLVSNGANSTPRVRGVNMTPVGRFFRYEFTAEFCCNCSKFT